MVLNYSATVWASALAMVMAAAGEESRSAFARSAIERSRGNEEAAREWLEKSLAGNPDSLFLAERCAAERWRTGGDRKRAEEPFLRVLASRKNDAEARVAYAGFLLRHSRGDDKMRGRARGQLSAALEIRPGEPAWIGMLFESADQTGPERREVLKRITRKDGASAMLFARLIDRLPDPDGELRKIAAARLKEAVSAEPGNPVLARSASEFFRRAGNVGEALEILRQHVKASPWSLDLRIRLAVLHFTAKQGEEGERLLKEVLEVDPSKVAAHRALAKYYRSVPDRPSAAAHESARLRVEGGGPDECLALAKEWIDLGRPAEARLVLEKAVFDHPEDFDLRLGLAEASRLDPAAEGKAADIFRAAKRLAERKNIAVPPAFHTEAAEAAIRENDTVAGEKHLREAIRSYPPEEKTATAAALRRLAGLWESEGKNPEAAAALRKRAAALAGDGR